MKGLQPVLKLFLILGGVLFIALGLNGQLRFLHPQSELGFFETRIESVESELMRRSPALRKNFAQFEICVRKKGCDVSGIIQERDHILQALWPDVFTRLVVNDDWGQGKMSKEHHRQFQEDVQGVGSKKQAKNCLPVLEYFLLSNTGQTISIYQGLQCPNSSPLSKD